MSGSSILNDVDNLLKSLEYDSDGSTEPSNVPSSGGLWEMGAGSAEPQNPDLMRGMGPSCFPARRGAASKGRTVLGPDGPVVVTALPEVDDDMERFPADADHEQQQREQFNYYTAAGRKEKHERLRQKLEKLKQKLEQGTAEEAKQLAALGGSTSPTIEEIDATEDEDDSDDDSSDTEEDEDGSDADSMATDETDSVGSAEDAQAELEEVDPEELAETESTGAAANEEETYDELKITDSAAETKAAVPDAKESKTAADPATPIQEPDVDTVSPRSWAGSEAEPLPPQPGFNYEAVDSDLELEPFDSTPRAADDAKESKDAQSSTPRAPVASASKPSASSRPPAPPARPVTVSPSPGDISRKGRVLDPAAAKTAAASTGELVQHGRNLVGGGAQVRNAPPLNASEQKQGQASRRRVGATTAESSVDARTEAVNEMLDELDRPRKKKQRDHKQKKRSWRSIWNIATSPELVTIYFYVILTIGFFWELVTAIRVLVRPALQQAVADKLEL